MGAYAGESRMVFGAPDEVGHEIYTILTHREDVLHSFSPPDQIQVDLNDLQASYIQHLQSQREQLLRVFRVKNGQEILRSPEAFFQTIVGEFQDKCRARLVWGRGYQARASATETHLLESAHTISFIQRPGGLQPSLWATVGYRDRRPTTYRAETNLHNGQSWQYVFASTADGFTVSKEGYERGQNRLYPIEDIFEKVSLLQALGVEMLDAVTTTQKGRRTTQAVRHEAARRRTVQLVHHRVV